MGGNREYLLKEELMYFVKVELTLMSETCYPGNGFRSETSGNLSEGNKIPLKLLNCLINMLDLVCCHRFAVFTVKLSLGGYSFIFHTDVRDAMIFHPSLQNFIVLHFVK